MAVADRVGLSWLITVRWTTLVACVGALVAGRSALQVPVAVGETAALIGVAAASNVWLMWFTRRGREGASNALAGGLISADVLLLSWILRHAGGVLNPASIFYLVEIVVAALVLGRQWTWSVTALSVAGYAMLFLLPNDELRAAQVMHPEIALHMRGMWFAFAVTALIIAALVTRLAMAIERRDRALADLGIRSARDARVAALATLAAGAAHELSTPLSTIALAASELERQLSGRSVGPGLQDDARLIRSETDRCRQILEAMAGHAGEPFGEPPRAATVGDVIRDMRENLGPREAARVSVGGDIEHPVVWPRVVVARAISNIVRNALQASPSTTAVHVNARAVAGVVELEVIDAGSGMSPAHAARAGEPFFTTKPAGTGTGLGLFVARSTVEQLGGRLGIVSTPGRGTTVTLRVPSDVLAGTRS